MKSERLPKGGNIVHEVDDDSKTKSVWRGNRYDAQCTE